MVLSNTATPRYYGEFREKVLSGQIPVNREIAMEMARIDELIANPNYYYEDQAIEGFILFCESEMTLTNGDELVLLETFKLWAEQLLAWFYFSNQTIFVKDPRGPGGSWLQRRVCKRLVNKQYLIVARGGAKSMYVTLLQAYFLTINTDTTHQITVAPTMRQAEEVMGPFRTAITRARGPLFRFMTAGSLQNTTGNRAERQKLSATKKGIENFMTASLLEVRPMSIDKLQSLRTLVNTVDEWLSGDVREDVVGAIEQGASKLDNYVIVAISSEGTVRNGPGDSMKMELAALLRNERYDPHTSIFHYRLDDILEVNNPEMWVKAQPNIGYTVSYETYARDVARAESVSTVANDILAKRFGIPKEGHSYFFTYEETIPHDRFASFYSLPCALGVDLSQGDDFCAFTLFFPLHDGAVGLIARSYITDRTMKKLHPAMKEKYELFLEEGSLIIMDGSVLDMNVVYEDIDQWIVENGYDVRAMGYDPYNSTDFVKSYIVDNGSYAVDKVIQGARTESVPLGEIKKLAEDRKLIFNQELMRFTMGNSIVLEDTNGNRKLLKARRKEKIDNVSALVNAHVIWSRFREAFE